MVSHKALLYEGVLVPTWLSGMPADWWDIYFDRVGEFSVSVRMGHA